MKILSIGNSFSGDAHKWLHDIALTDGYELDTYNLFIGGCSLETHWNNVLEDNEAYDLYGNSETLIKKISIKEALESDNYDVVTLQQVSGLSGIEESYFPFITNLADLVKEKQPNAKLYLHRTWSYEIDSSWGGFATNYNNDQKEMYNKICSATTNVAKIINADIIPAGDIIQSLRENTKEFDYNNGGLSLCRDGGHLSWDYGRFAAAAVWYKTLTGRNANPEKFAQMNKEFDIRLVNIIVSKVL